MRSSFVAQVWFFLHASCSDFPNQVFSIPHPRLLFFLWLECLNTKIRYHTCDLWTFWFTHALLCVCSSFVAHACFSLYVWRPEFQNQAPYDNILHKLRFTCLNIIIRYHTSQQWIFLFTHALLCVRSSLVAQVCLFLHAERLTFKMKLSWYHIIDSSVSFGFHVWT